MKTIGCLVTGKGEVDALPILVRAALARLDVYTVQPVRPWPVPETKLLQVGSNLLERQVTRLRNRYDAVLVLLDLEDDCPAVVAPQLQERAEAVCADKPCAVVCAYRELETWFIHDARNLFDIAPLPDPEDRRDAKGWLRAHAVPGYNEVADSPGLCARLDHDHVRSQSDSFRVLLDRIEAIVDALDL